MSLRAVHNLLPVVILVTIGLQVIHTCRGQHRTIDDGLLEATRKTVLLLRYMYVL